MEHEVWCCCRVYRSPDRRSRYTCPGAETQGGRGLAESIEGAGLTRWDSPVTARGQLARTELSDDGGGRAKDEETEVAR